MENSLNGAALRTNAGNGRKRRAAIIGAGTAGLAMAWFLRHSRVVTLYDKADRAGGHLHTVPIEYGGARLNAEVAVEFLFSHTYPTVMALLGVLGVRWRRVAASLTIFDAAGRTLVLPPRRARHVLPLVGSPRRLRDLLRFVRFIDSVRDPSRYRESSVTVRQHIETLGLSDGFARDFLLPILGASWGVAAAEMIDFPIYNVLNSWRRSSRVTHTMVDVEDGLEAYPAALVRELEGVELRLGAAVESLHRVDGLFHIRDGRGEVRTFDELIVATSSRDAAALLAEIPLAAALRELLGRFRHFEVRVAVHSDRSFMPAHTADWSTCNFFRDNGEARMSIWSGRKQRAPVFRSWLADDRPKPREIHYEAAFNHLLVSPDNLEIRRQLASMQGRDGIWLVGMYAGSIDNNEGALESTLPVARALDPQSPNLARLQAALAREREDWAGRRRLHRTRSLALRAFVR